MKKTLICSIALFAAAMALAQDADQPRSLRSLRPNGLRPVAAPAPAAEAAAADTASDSDTKEAPALNWDGAPVDIVF